MWSDVADAGTPAAFSRSETRTPVYAVLDAIFKRLRSSVKRLGAEHARCPAIGIGASLWNWTVPLPDAMRAATGRARMDTVTTRASGPAPKLLHDDQTLRPPKAA